MTTKTVYIKNTGTTAAALTLSTSDLTPAADGKISVTWVPADPTLAANAQTTAVLTLHVDSTISGVTTFDINVIITGTEIS